jgi:Bacterial dnaA protein helix-turn-helix
MSAARSPSQHERLPSVRLIAEVTSMRYGVSYTDLLSSRRQAHVVPPRHVALYVARKLTRHSYPEIGRRFGGRDHTSVMHACRAVKTRLQQGEDGLAAAIAEIEQAAAGGVLAEQRTGSVVFADADAFAVSRRVLDIDACRVSADELRAMAGLIIGTIAPLVEHEEAPHEPVPLPPPPARDQRLRFHVSQALATWATFTSAETGPAERPARKAVEAAMKALRQTLEQETIHA